MDTTHFRDWYRKKTEIANSIVETFGQEAEVDAEILLCCATSALASQMWPGERIDKKRFVEFLIRFSDPTLSLQKISIPLLANKLEKKGDLDTAIRVREKFLTHEPILLDGDWDRSEKDVCLVFSSLERKKIRGCSYAASIYVDLRSGLVHRYQLSSHLVAFGISARTDIPSYVNIQDNPPDSTAGAFFSGETRRYLYFPYQYLAKALGSSADSAFACWDACASWNQPKPERWWIEG